ncbi:MAG: flavodoxin-dependent (E)-4-hydroxy-3-methylbut-2-enyl-diphosphate synthase [Anaerovoracaceae bacterium]|nr:flavodoxin-dependent (E)-4-hydroxy-3-methylbut-2-enyl-diphosphate synthase [Anaerovoracaceae bacterium]
MSSKKIVRVGDVLIGGGNPVVIQSMTNVNPLDEIALINQVSALADAGCQIVRLAVPNMEAAEVFGRVRKKVKIPLVADIHFDYRLAIAALERGADKIRINPGNIGSIDKVRKVVKAAGERGVPIRVGVNSGSLEKDILSKRGGVDAEGLAESAIRNLRMIEDMGYDNLIISLKSSDVAMNYKAHKIIARKTDYPIHIGITEAGTPETGRLKSGIGLGALLLEGIGDTMRVSLTADPLEEVKFAKDILYALGMRKDRVNLVSCPTCGRTSIDLVGLANKVEEALKREKINDPITVAIMGCVVNGPGEAKEADYGIAGGIGKGIIFSKGEVLETVEEEKLPDELIKIIKTDRTDKYGKR